MPRVGKSRINSISGDRRRAGGIIVRRLGSPLLLALVALLLVGPVAARAEPPGPFPNDEHPRQLAQKNGSSQCPEIMRRMTAARNWPESCGTGKPPKALLQKDGISGLWEITADGNPFFDEILVALSRYQCGVSYLIAAADLCITGSARKKGKSNYSHINPRIMASEPDRIQIHLQSGGFSGRTKFWVEARPTGEPNLWVGKWQYGKKKPQVGRVVMKRRPPPKIQEITIKNAGHGDNNADRYAYGDRPGRILRRHAITCGAGRSRSNCDRVWITLTGENLAGAHNVWIDPASHMEIRDAGWTCRNGKRREGGAGWTKCAVTARAGDGVAAISLRLVLWDGIKPGRRTLWVNGQPVPFDLVIQGHPDSTKNTNPMVSKVEIVDPATMLPVDTVAVGDSFRIRVTFAADPGRAIGETVTIRTSAGTTRDVRLSGKGRVIVSDPIRVTPAEPGRPRAQP